MVLAPGKESLVRDSLTSTGCPCWGHPVELGIRLWAGQEGEEKKLY